MVLCSIPPGQSQYVQRVGRAGRKDGNSLTIAVANAQPPHDLFFYAEPSEMIAGGGVQPPDVFLNASAVLERQFVAFCMDSWVKNGLDVRAVPNKLGSCLNRLQTAPIDFFPLQLFELRANQSGQLVSTFYGHV